MVAFHPYIDKKVALLGLGITGQSLISHLKKFGINPICWDDEETQREKFKAKGIEIMPGRNAYANLQIASLLNFICFCSRAICIEDSEAKIICNEEYLSVIPIRKSLKILIAILSEIKKIIPVIKKAIAWLIQNAMLADSVIFSFC